jgi:hypothetical protein
LKAPRRRRRLALEAQKFALAVPLQFEAVSGSGALLMKALAAKPSVDVAESRPQRANVG